MVGIVLGLCGFFIFHDIKEILISVGTTLIGSSTINFVYTFFLAKKTNAEKPNLEPDDALGLKKVYRHRYEKNGKVNHKILTDARSIDAISQRGLDKLRQELGNKLLQRLEDGLEMKILVPETLEKFDKDANSKLVTWFAELRPNLREKVVIRYYKGMPQDLYFRVNGMIFTGPYFLTKDEQFNITYEFEAKSDGGKIYSEYFNDLWNKSEGGTLKL